MRPYQTTNPHQSRARNEAATVPSTPETPAQRNTGTPTFVGECCNTPLPTPTRARAG